MTDIAAGRLKQKKSKLTFDRLLSVKKHIMDSLSLLSRHDKQSSLTGKSNEISNHTRKASYCKDADFINNGNNTSNNHQTSNCAEEHLHSITDIASCMTDLPAASLSHNPLQTIQTFPGDDYPPQRILQEHYSIQNQVPPLKIQDHTNTGKFETQNKLPNSNTRSVKDQGIQTEMRGVLGVNADIVRYLGQFNDKLAFNWYAPSQLGRPSGSFPYYYEQGYYVYQDARNNTDYLSKIQLPRRPEEYGSFCQQDYNSCDYYYKYQNNHPPLMNHYHPQGEKGLFYMLNESQRHQGFENIKAIPIFSPTDGINFLAPPKFDTRPSEDSGSILSSETDSDFMFFPCSSLSQNFQCMTVIDSRSSSYLSPPHDLPENISTDFSWRSDFYGTSLDEVTLQFFLDDDALSDDVFVDDEELLCAGNVSRDTDKQCVYDTASEMPGNLTCDMSPQSNRQSEPGTLDSYGDNCYAYRYADIDEVLNSNNNDSPQEVELSVTNQTSEDKLSPVSPPDEYNPPSRDPEIKCSCEESHLELCEEFSNVFDSLRRNSTQTKARKMWRQRRAKSKKNSAAVSKTEGKNEQVTVSLCQPRVFTFDHLQNHNHDNRTPVKPLRGILKKTESKLSNMWEPEEHQAEVTDIFNSANINADIFMLDLNIASHPNSPLAYASMQKRVSPCFKIPSVDEVLGVI